MSSNKFLVSYEPGARGEFLLSILIDDYKSHESWYKVAGPNKNFIRIHPVDKLQKIYSVIKDFPEQFDSYEQLFKTCQDLNIISIRIQIEDIDDMMDVVCFDFLKNQNLGIIDISELPDNHFEIPSLLSHMSLIETQYKIKFLSGAIWNEIYDLDYYGHYDYCIPFKKLFDIDYIKNFYFEIHKKNLKDDVIDRIIKNISIQQRWSQRNKQ